MGSCAPDAQMPDWANNVNDNSLTFRSAESLAYSIADTWGNEGALGWNLGMRWGTALMFVDLASALSKIMPEYSSPFLVIHDPEDQVCSIEGPRKLVSICKTPEDRRKIIEVGIYFDV